MNPILLTFADGTSFFVGLGGEAFAVLLLLCARNGFVRSVLIVIALVSIAVVVISATPLPLWGYVLWFLPSLAFLLTSRRGNTSPRIRATWAGVTVLVSFVFGLAETPYHSLPQVVVPQGTTIYVLGDSISAGMGTRVRCWPAVLGEIIGVPVVNLAKPGAKIQHAMAQARGVATSRSLVIVELGGNDLLSETDVASFRRQLDDLVSALCSAGHTVLMLELPLFPFRNAWGAAQRQIAAKYGAVMLPKRYFAKVLATRNGTIDGLHLSQEGHEAMARLIADVLQTRS